MAVFYLLPNRRAASDRATFVPSTMCMVINFFALIAMYARLSELSPKKSD